MFLIFFEGAGGCVLILHTIKVMVVLKLNMVPCVAMELLRDLPK